MTPKTDTSEQGLEETIIRAMTGRIDVLSPKHKATETSVPVAGGTGWLLGDNDHYDREFCIDLVQLRGFLMATQGDVVEKLSLDVDGPARRKFLSRLEGEIAKRGVIDVLRHGVKHGPVSIDLFYGTPSADNAKAIELHARNRFSVTRQLRYSLDEKKLALDAATFINGLPIATFELKNRITKQTVSDAVEQYKLDRSPKEKLFAFKRCVAHFAVDDQEVRFCTQLKGKASWFLPFNKGHNDGAGNPPNPDGIKTAYLWEEILTPASLTEILESYAQVVEIKDQKTGKKSATQIWPRYHQLDVVRKLLADAAENGTGQRYLIQHSAGSGKSNSIAWLAHQLIALRKNKSPVFDSVIVVTDRTILDSQIRATIKQFAQISSTIGAVTGAGGSKSTELAEFLAGSKQLIITTVQTFPFVLEQISQEQKGRSFAVIIDEAHSSQGGKTASAMSETLGSSGEEDDEEESFEDQINSAIEARRLADNASYFAFTATPKNKTLEIFGTALPPVDGKVRHRPFHSYTMKQAIEEGFILDVLQNYTSVESYYRLAKKIEEDPEFDSKKAKAKLRLYVESHDHAIKVKAAIMVDHFLDSVVGKRKINGEARAMVVCDGIGRAIQYYHAISDELRERKSGYEAIVAFSGEHTYGSAQVSESTLNSFPSSQIAKKIREDPYRILVCADKFQTGYDEPLLHTMYVDKTLSGIKTVQTLSRLNRAAPGKHDTFVLDFMNTPDDVEEAFSDYYRTTILSDKTDPDKLHDLQVSLDNAQVYTSDEVDALVELYLGGAELPEIHAILDACVERYVDNLDEDEQVMFKGDAKSFVRAYDFLATILTFKNPEWEKRSIFLRFLHPKLPAPVETDLSAGILDAIDMDSYRAEVLAATSISLEDEDGEIDPAPTGSGGHLPEPELDLLSSILNSFNDLFGNIDWADEDRVRRLITEEIPAKVSEDPQYQNAMKNSDRENARIEHDDALKRVIVGLVTDPTQIFKQFSDNDDFQRWLSQETFDRTYIAPDADSARQLKKLDAALDQVELKIRDVVAAGLDGSLAELPEHVKEKVGERVTRELTRNPGVDENALRSLPRILEHFDLRELQDTITAKPLWPRFSDRFGKKEQLVNRFGQLAELRNALRHTRTVEPATRLDGEAAIHWFGAALKTGPSTTSD
jgi:type I restriction enzyme R subunit